MSWSAPPFGKKKKRTRKRSCGAKVQQDTAYVAVLASNSVGTDYSPFTSI